MTAHKSIPFVILFYVLNHFLLFSQETFSNRYNASYVTMGNGLLHNYIDYIYKDTSGFLWIATGGGGLSRYDGYDFVHFNTHTPRVSLKNNFIKKLCEDNFHRLWIISESGIDIINLKTLQNETPVSENKLLGELLASPVTEIKKDSKGNIWAYSINTIYKITFNDSGDVIEVFSGQIISHTLAYVGLNDIDHDGEMCVGIGNSILKLYINERKELVATPRFPNVSLPGMSIIFALEKKENELWIGTNDGLFRYNIAEGILKAYHHRKENARSLTQNYITTLAITADKQLIAGTLKGINIYNPITDDFERITHHENDNQRLLNSNFINCILIDGDRIWLGTETGGINKLTPRRISIHNYIHRPDDLRSISNNPVNSIYEDNRSRLWVGTVEGGLNRKLPHSDSFTHYTAETTPYLAHNSISAITSNGNDQLWVGSWGKGITVLDIEHPGRKALKYISSATHPSMSLDFIGVLQHDSINNGMWIGANPGLYFFSFDTGLITSPFADGKAYDIHGSIGSMIDAHGKLWIGSQDGVFVIDLHSKHEDSFAYTHLKHKLDSPTSTLVEKPSCFLQAKDATIWVGSYGNGIYKYVEQENRFVGYTSANGLINNTTHAILEDQRGNLWISTINGISCLNPSTNRFINYTKEDGLLSNQFYWNAAYSSRSGLLYFGSISGLTSISMTRREEVTTPPHVTLTRLLIMNEEVFADKKHIPTDIAQADKLLLHEREKSFSIEFSALNYDVRDASSYEYRLLGFDTDWIKVPANRRFASYTNIKHGKYKFQVRYIPEGDTQEQPITEITVVVRPFFYKEPWFVLLIATLIAGSGIFLYKRRILGLKRQKELLRRTVEERTKELAEQNQKLTDQNEKITRQKTQLIEMSKKVQELTADKLAFFTNITHEFRTPITLIIGPIEKALKLSYNPQVIEQLNYVKRNSKYLLSLINQLMDFRKIESGKLEIHRSKGDITQFIDSIVTPFAIFAEERNITIRTLYRMGSPYMLFDQDAFQKILTNLLSNAIKYTPDSGKITIYATAYVDKQKNENRFLLKIEDSGAGIPEEDLQRIFNRFYQSAAHTNYPVYGQSGTGIGLYLTKRIAQLHGGVIKACNNRCKGASFCISLPLVREESESKQPPAFNPPLALNEAPDFVPAHFIPNRLTILVVEDNTDMRGFIRSILSDQYNVLEAENGAEALNLLSAVNVDFIVSDLMMPVMDGIEFSRHVKESFAISHIPFLMLTAKTSQESRIESYKIGVDEYLLKPFDEELLLTRIHNILENRKRYQLQFAQKMEVESLNIETESSDKKFVDKVMETIKANYKNSEYETADFIAAMAVSKSLLNKKMQNLLGQSIGQFIRNYRLNIARELIEQNKTTHRMNVSEIAYEVGFNDPKYFTRCFTKRFNTSPSSMMENQAP